MPFFKKHYSAHDIEVLKANITCDMYKIHNRKDHVNLFNSFIRLQKIVDDLKKLQEATGQEVQILDNKMYRLNNDGTLYYRNLDRDFTYNQDVD